MLRKLASEFDSPDVHQPQVITSSNACPFWRAFKYQYGVTPREFRGFPKFTRRLARQSNPQSEIHLAL